MFDAVLFDLDGTLADTAPDLGQAVNALLREEGHIEQPLVSLRPFTSQGVRGLLGAAFGIAPDHPDYPRLAQRFLDLYEARLCAETRLFAGIPELLDQLEALHLGWGVVTNKRRRFTEPLAAQLGLTPRTTCLVSGDTTPEAKPSPLPLLMPAICSAAPPNAPSMSATTAATSSPARPPVVCLWLFLTATSAMAGRWTAGVPI